MARPNIRAAGRWPLALVVTLTPLRGAAAPGPAASQSPDANRSLASTSSSAPSPDASKSPANTWGSAPSPDANRTAAPTASSSAPSPDANRTAAPPASTSVPAPSEPRISDIPATPRAAGEPESPTFTTQDGWTTPKPGPKTSTSGQDSRRWQIRQAPLAGAETSWGPPGGQMPEYHEFVEPPPGKGTPPRGTGRIAGGATLGVSFLGLAIAGIVGATTTMLGDHKRVSVPMIGVGLVGSAIGWGLFADGVLRRKKFLRWQAKGAEVSLTPALVPGRLAGVNLGLRF